MAVLRFLRREPVIAPLFRRGRLALCVQIISQNPLWRNTCMRWQLSKSFQYWLAAEPVKTALSMLAQLAGLLSWQPTIINPFFDGVKV